MAEPESDSPSPSTRQIPVPPSDEFSVPSVASSSYPERGGNSVNPLVDGEVAFREICRAVEAAEASVWVTVTFLWEAFRMPDARGIGHVQFERVCEPQDKCILGISGTAGLP